MRSFRKLFLLYRIFVQNIIQAQLNLPLLLPCRCFFAESVRRSFYSFSPKYMPAHSKTKNHVHVIFCLARKFCQPESQQDFLFFLFCRIRAAEFLQFFSEIYACPFPAAVDFRVGRKVDFSEVEIPDVHVR